MGLETVAMLSSMALSAGSSIYGGMQQDKASRRAGRRANRLENRAFGMMEEGPTSVEQLIQEYLGNIGQDGILQQMRASPEGQYQQDVINTLLGITESGGDPFDTSELFAALEPIEADMRDEAVAELRGGASGLGQRFGSASQRAEAELLSDIVNQSAGRRAQIQQGSYEAGQGRKMGALGMLLDRLARAENLATTQTGVETSLLQMLLGGEQARRGYNAQLFGFGAGMPQAPPQMGMANAGGDIAQLLMMYPFMQQLLGGQQTAIPSAPADPFAGMAAPTYNMPAWAY